MTDDSTGTRPNTGPGSALPTGLSASTAMTQSARELDPDLMPWERQPWETQPAYEAFTGFLAQEPRKVGDHGPSSYRWSKEHAWGFRAYEYDRYLARQDTEAMVRYRVSMNERQRALARLVQAKIAAHVQQHLDPSKMSGAEATRWWDLAVKVERDAAGATLNQTVDPYVAPDTAEGADPNGSIADLLGLDGMTDEDAAVALYRLMGKPT